jgi:hypothetical protein
MHRAKDIAEAFILQKFIARLRVAMEQSTPNVLLTMGLGQVRR